MMILEIFGAFYYQQIVPQLEESNGALVQGFRGFRSKTSAPGPGTPTSFLISSPILWDYLLNLSVINRPIWKARDTWGQFLLHCQIWRTRSWVPSDSAITRNPSINSTNRSCPCQWTWRLFRNNFSVNERSVKLLDLFQIKPVLRKGSVMSLLQGKLGLWYDNSPHPGPRLQDLVKGGHYVVYSEDKSIWFR